VFLLLLYKCHQTIFFFVLFVLLGRCLLQVMHSFIINKNSFYENNSPNWFAVLCKSTHSNCLIQQIWLIRHWCSGYGCRIFSRDIPRPKSFRFSRPSLERSVLCRCRWCAGRQDRSVERHCAQSFKVLNTPPLCCFVYKHTLRIAKSGVRCQGLMSTVSIAA